MFGIECDSVVDVVQIDSELKSSILCDDSTFSDSLENTSNYGVDYRA